MDWTSNNAHFQLTEIDNDEEDRKMLLAVTPLTQPKDKFLCMSAIVVRNLKSTSTNNVEAL
ncbi:MAG: hypothetical protein M3044_07190 [Thermoproteota archaeon]|nr:hypothetical protein [Thermoproteota archaeon]